MWIVVVGVAIAAVYLYSAFFCGQKRGPWRYQRRLARWKHIRHPVYVLRNEKNLSRWGYYFGCVAGADYGKREYREFEYAAEAALEAFHASQQKEAQALL